MNDFPYGDFSASEQLQEERRFREEASYRSAVAAIHDWLRVNRPDLAEPITTLLTRLAA